MAPLQKVFSSSPSEDPFPILSLHRSLHCGCLLVCYLSRKQSIGSLREGCVSLLPDIQ
jgi:hypothetical protein